MPADIPLKVLVVWYVHIRSVVLSISFCSDYSSSSFLDCLHFTFSAIMMCAAYTSDARFADPKVVWFAHPSLTIASQTNDIVLAQEHEGQCIITGVGVKGPFSLLFTRPGPINHRCKTVERHTARHLT